MPEFYKIVVREPRPLRLRDGSQLTLNGEGQWAKARQYCVEDEDGNILPLPGTDDGWAMAFAPLGKVCEHDGKHHLVPGKDYIPNYALDEICQELAKIKVRRAEQCPSSTR